MTTPYHRMGGEAGIWRFTNRFYALMGTLPEAAACRAEHPPSLGNAERRLFEYLSGWLGGPKLHIERQIRYDPLLRGHAPARDLMADAWIRDDDARVPAETRAVRCAGIRR